MTARTLAFGLAAGRIGLGAAFLLAPGKVGAAWTGRDARRPGAQVLGVGFGARDLALGLGTVAALSQGHGAVPWVRAGALADLGDLLATLRARRSLPALPALGV